MIAIIKNGTLERIVETTGKLRAGQTTMDLPDDFDPIRGNYVFDGQAFVPNVALALTQLRAERDAKIAATDWTQLADVPAATAALWKPYRQALRDLPDAADPFAPIWPTPPA